MYKSIGIASFNFGINKKAPFEFSGKDYLKELKYCLEGINGLDIICLKHKEEFSNLKGTVKEQPPVLGKNPGYFPRLEAYSEIAFKIHIPFDIQANYLNQDIDILETKSEDFLVSLYYSHRSIVAICQTLNRNEESDGTDACEIVIELLKEKINSPDNKSYIRFENSEESPFLMEIHIIPFDLDEVKNESEFLIEFFPDPSYDKTYIKYNPSRFENSDEAFNSMKLQIIGEFGMFYEFEHAVLKCENEWEQIESIYKKLIGIRSKSLIIRFILNVFRRRFFISELRYKLVDFESQLLFNEIRLEEHKKRIFSPKQVFFKEPIFRDVYQVGKFPTVQMKELIIFIDGRRIKNLEIIIALISAIVGGAIGALLSTL